LAFCIGSVFFERQSVQILDKFTETFFPLSRLLLFSGALGCLPITALFSCFGCLSTTALSTGRLFPASDAYIASAQLPYFLARKRVVLLLGIENDLFILPKNGTL